MWFIRELLRRVFTRTPDHVDLWSGTVASILTVAAHFLPSWEEAVKDLLWQIPLWIVVAVISVRLLMAPYWIARDQRERIRLLEAEVSRLTDEYTYSLALERIDQREARELNRLGTDVVRRDVSLLLRLKNSISRPIEYSVRQMRINGTELTNFSNRGAVISGGVSTTFYTPTWQMDPSPDALKHKHNYTMEFEIDYGQPGVMQRTRICRISIEAYPLSETTDMKYEVNDDVERKTDEV